MINFKCEIKYKSYDEWAKYSRLDTDNKIITKLDDILISIDCTREYKGYRMMSTKDFRYREYVELYLRLSSKIINQIIYNKAINKLINADNYNIWFEDNCPIVPINVKVNNIRNKKPKNEYIRLESKNLFEDGIIYTYYNAETGDEIVSKDPNLLTTLNAKKSRKSKENKRGKTTPTINFILPIKK